MSTRVKICGLRTEAALDAALDSGADLVGFVLYPRSPRNVSVAEAAALAQHARAQGSAKTVTLLVDPDDALIDQVVAEVKPDFLQLHGHESLERVAEIRRRSGLSVIKAVPVATANEVTAALPYLAPGRASILMFDAKPPADPNALPGGNGLSFDWRILDAARPIEARPNEAHPDKALGQAPFALAGGLTPENVAAAIALTGAGIVDVSSGVESSPGEKDPELIRRFLRAAKAAKEA